MSSKSSPELMPVFLNWQSDIVQPIRFAVIAWDGATDALYALEDAAAFDRQCEAAVRQGVAVHPISAAKAADWIAGGNRAVLHEVSVSGIAAFGHLKLAAG